jgi:hypothetical protein
MSDTVHPLVVALLAEEDANRDAIARAESGDTITLADVRRLSALNRRDLINEAHRAGRVTY